MCCFQDGPRSITAAQNRTLMAVHHELVQVDIVVASFNALSVINLGRLFNQIFGIYIYCEMWNR